MEFARCEVSRRTGSVVQARLSGELDVYGAPLVREELEGLAESCQVLVLDLGGLSFIDTSGLAMILLLWRAGRQEGRYQVLLYGLPPQARQAVSTAGLTRLLRIVETRDELDALFGAPRGETPSP